MPRRPRRILFIHQNFPAQFRHVARALAGRPDTEVLAVTREDNLLPRIVPTLTYPYRPDPDSFGHPLAEHYAKRTARGLAVASFLTTLQASGYVPDVVVGHGGWGETLFVRDVWPRARLILHAEFYYAAEGADVAFDPEFAPVSGDALAFRARVRARNAAMIQALVDADLGLAPTVFQASTFPSHLRSKIAVVHEGIDTAVVAPRIGISISLRLPPEGRTLTLNPGDEVLTFVNRNLEPYRGYHVFMRALPAILAARPDLRVIIVGDDQGGYGPSPPAGSTWKEIFLREVASALDLSRIHFVGRLPYATYLAVLQISRLHVYATYPFVLSWSMLEAMSAGALVLASDTAPVREIISDGENGLLFPFFAPETLAERAIDALRDAGGHDVIRKAARKTIVDGYDLTSICLPKLAQLIRDPA
ncbi:glycosyltransferase [Methylorubrum populi]